MFHYREMFTGTYSPSLVSNYQRGAYADRRVDSFRYCFSPACSISFSSAFWVIWTCHSWAPFLTKNKERVPTRFLLTSAKHVFFRNKERMLIMFVGLC